MYLEMYYSWYDFDIEKVNHHKLVGWKRLGFNKLERDGFDLYRMRKEIPFTWDKTYKVVNEGLNVLRGLYNAITFTNDFDFHIVMCFTEAFVAAEKYIMSLKGAYVGSSGIWVSELLSNPALVFVRNIVSNNGNNPIGMDGRDTLRIRICDGVNPIQKNVGDPILKNKYYTCPVCGENVYKNYRGCMNCKNIINWENVILGKL